MTPIASNDDLDLEVQLGDNSWAPINDMTSFESTVSRSVTRTRVFMRSLAHTRAGAREYTIECEGLLNTDDPAQMRIRAQEAAGLPVNVRVQPLGLVDPDGVGGQPEAPAGYTVLCMVTGVRHSGAAGDEYQGWGFSLVPIADKVLVGAGPIV